MTVFPFYFTYYNVAISDKCKLKENWMRGSLSTYFPGFLSDCLLRLWWLRVVDFRLTVQRIWYWLIYILDLRFVLVYNCGLILRNKRICYVMLCFLQLCANRVVSLLCPCARFYCAVGERRRERYEITVDMDHVPPH